MVWLDLKKAGIEVERFKEMGRERGLKFSRGRIVVHYQICEEAVQRLEDLLTDIWSK